VPERAIPTYAVSQPAGAALAILAIVLTTAGVLAAASVLASRSRVAST